MIANSDPLIFWALHGAFASVFAYSLYQDIVVGYRRRRSLFNANLGADAMERFRFTAVQLALGILLLHVIDVADGINHKLAITVIDMGVLSYLSFRSGWWLDKVGSRSTR